MTDEEKLQDYLRKNARKEKKVEAPEPEVAIPAHFRSKTTPTEWYKDKLWAVLRFVVIVGFPLPVAVLAVMNQDWDLDTDDAIMYGTIYFAAEILFVAGLLSYKLMRYNRWMKGEYYKISGWQEFFSNRTKDFWNQRNYTNVRINFNLSDEASNLHREVLKTFTAKVTEKWKKDYDEMDFVGKDPKALQGNGSSISGDISQRELVRLLRIMNPKFIPVAKLLGKYLADVVIHSSSKETKHEITEKSDADDQYDKHQSWVSRHEPD